MKKKCLLICYTNLAGDPRVVKHYEALKDTYEVITAGVSPLGSEAHFIQIREINFWDNLSKAVDKKPLLKTLFYPIIRGANFLRFKVFNRFYFLRYWDIKRISDYIRIKSKGDFDLIVGNDINTLPLIVTLSGVNTKIVYDAHEYHAEEYGERPFWVKYNRPLVQYLYSRYINKVGICITVGENIAKRYEADYHKNFEIIYNAPPYSQVKFSKVNPADIKLVYSGMFGLNRNVDQVIKAMDFLPSNYTLHLLITNVTEDLHRMINKSGAGKRIKLHKAVALTDVAEYLSQFDLGVHLMASVNFNNDNALPNKYFQYVQARLVTVFGPLKEIELFTKSNGTGVICKGYTAVDLADTIKQLSPEDINRIKENNNRNAELFCEQNEVLKLKKIYEQISN